ARVRGLAARIEDAIGTQQHGMPGRRRHERREAGAPRLLERREECIARLRDGRGRRDEETSDEQLDDDAARWRAREHGGDGLGTILNTSGTYDVIPNLAIRRARAGALQVVIPQHYDQHYRARRFSTCHEWHQFIASFKTRRRRRRVYSGWTGATPEFVESAYSSHASHRRGFPDARCRSTFRHNRRLESNPRRSRHRLRARLELRLLRSPGRFTAPGDLSERWRRVLE